MLGAETGIDERGWKGAISVCEKRLTVPFLSLLARSLSDFAFVTR
jgi:hypothetical protein